MVDSRGPSHSCKRNPKPIVFWISVAASRLRREGQTLYLNLAPLQYPAQAGAIEHYPYLFGGALLVIDGINRALPASVPLDWCTDARRARCRSS